MEHIYLNYNKTYYFKYNSIDDKLLMKEIEISIDDKLLMKEIEIMLYGKVKSKMDSGK